MVFLDDVDDPKHDPGSSVIDDQGSESASESGTSPLLILYGSVTGNAQDVAERIGRETIRRNIASRVMAMDAYPLESLIDETLVIFVCSTTGNGVEPANMSPMWRALLRSDLPEDLLDTMHFSVFGLGDSGYERFNWAAKMLQRRLLSLGGIEFLRRGDADDRDFYGIDSALDPWLQELFAALSSILPSFEEVAAPLPSDRPEPRLRLTAVDPADALAAHARGLGLGSNSELGWFTLTRNERITRKDWFQDVRHLDFQADEDIQYDPGDVAVIYPENAKEDVDWLLNRMEWTKEADSLYSFESTNPDWPLAQGFPSSSTIRDLLTKQLDISAIPRRSFFECIRHFASDEREKEKLDDFCTKEGLDDLHDYTTRPRRTSLEVLAEFHSVRIPLAFIADAFTSIRPRQFSIASSVSAHPKQVQLCVAIIRYRSNLKAPRKGLCTSWFVRLQEGARIRIGFYPGTMRLPTDSTKPIVMIGPGTGVAPLRAFLEERVRNGGLDNSLYFGCRSLSSDCHYRPEWETYQSSGQLVFRVAASRDQESKVYVQHLIQEDASLIVDRIVEKNGYIFVCGSSNQMPRAVRRAVEAALASQLDWDEERAGSYVKAMEQAGRWGEECW